MQADVVGVAAEAVPEYTAPHSFLALLVVAGQLSPAVLQPGRPPLSSCSAPPAAGNPGWCLPPPPPVRARPLHRATSTGRHHWLLGNVGETMQQFVSWISIESQYLRIDVGISHTYRVSQNYPNILFWRRKGRAKQIYISSWFNNMVNLLSNIEAHSVRQILLQNHREIERNVKLRLVG